MTSFRFLITNKLFLFLFVLPIYSSCSGCNNPNNGKNYNGTEKFHADLQDRVNLINEDLDNQAKEATRRICDKLFSRIQTKKSFFLPSEKEDPNSAEYKLKANLSICLETVKENIRKNLNFTFLTKNILDEQTNICASITDICTEEFEKLDKTNDTIYSQPKSPAMTLIYREKINHKFNLNDYITSSTTGVFSQDSLLEGIGKNGFGSDGLCFSLSKIYYEFVLENKENQFLTLLAEAAFYLNSGSTIMLQELAVKEFIEKVIYSQYVKFVKLADRTIMPGPKLLSDMHLDLKNKLIIPNDLLKSYSLEKFTEKIKEFESYNFISQIFLYAPNRTSSHAITINKKNGFFTVYDPNTGFNEFSNIDDSINHISNIANSLDYTQFSLVDCIRN